MSEPFVTAEAAGRGFSRGQLRGPRVRRLFPGVHAEADAELTLPMLVAGAQRLLPPSAVPASLTALRLAGAAAGPVYPLRFLTTHPHQVRRPDLLVTRVSVLPPLRNGAVDVPAAFAASGTLVDLVELVAAGDLLVRLGRTTPADLRGAAASFRGRGAVAARRAAALVRERVDSPQETELRLCLTLAGLPEPECNPLVGRAGALARVDLRYREQRVALEYEGDQHRTDRWQWNRDIERHEQLLSDGWTVVRITAERLRRPQSVVARVLAALRDGGYRGSDPGFSLEWRDLYSPTARAMRLANGLEVLRCALDARGTPGEG